MNKIEMDVLAPVRHALIQRSDELEKRLGNVEKLLSSPHSKGFAEQATERELAQIHAAIARIDDGSYGICTYCGREIAPRRLEVQPEAALCIDCAS